MRGRRNEREERGIGYNHGGAYYVYVRSQGEDIGIYSCYLCYP